MVERIKKDLRINHDKLDDDISANIESCKMDLKRVGVKEAMYSSLDDPLIVQAIKLYLRWKYDYNSKGSQYLEAYEKLRDSISLCGDYNE